MLDKSLFSSDFIETFGDDFFKNYYLFSLDILDKLKSGNAVFCYSNAVESKVVERLLLNGYSVLGYQDAFSQVELESNIPVRVLNRKDNTITVSRIWGVSLDVSPVNFLIKDLKVGDLDIFSVVNKHCVPVLLCKFITESDIERHKNKFLT